MGWEEEIPKIPTRQEEIDFINKLEQNYRDQGAFQLFMSESLRQTKMNQQKDVQDFRKHWTFNFMIGLCLSGPLLFPISNLWQNMRTGVPYYYRPKNIFYTPRLYQQNRKNSHMLIQFPAWIFLSLWYAHYFTDRSKISDQYLEKNKVVKML